MMMLNQIAWYAWILLTLPHCLHHIILHPFILLQRELSQKLVIGALYLIDISISIKKSWTLLPLHHQRKTYHLMVLSPGCYDLHHLSLYSPLSYFSYQCTWRTSSVSNINFLLLVNPNCITLTPLSLLTWSTFHHVLPCSFPLCLFPF